MLAVFIGLLIFGVFSLIRVLFKSHAKNTIQQEAIPFRADFDENSNNAPPSNTELQAPEEVNPYIPEPELNETHDEGQETVQANTMPDVPGQTQEELKAPEPLQEPVALKVEAHSPLDPFEKSENVAMFGSNLRHPEASIEPSKSSFGGLENEIASGLASQVTKPSDIDKAPFSAEMAQNGGEFMNGIFAFDSTQEGSFFSSL